MTETTSVTVRLPAIAAASELIKAKSFTIAGEAVALGPNGLSRFEELRHRAASCTAFLYAFDAIEHDVEDMRGRTFLDRKAALARLLRGVKAGTPLNERIAEDGLAVFAHACRLCAEGIVSIARTQIRRRSSLLDDRPPFLDIGLCHARRPWIWMLSAFKEIERNWRFK